MKTQALKVERHIVEISETSVLVDVNAMSKDNLIEYVTNNEETMEWDEVDVITNFKIVENYA